MLFLCKNKNVKYDKRKKDGFNMNVEIFTMYAFIFLICLLIIAIGVMVLVIMGNLSMMKILAKCGVAVFSNNIEKDSKLLHFVNKESVCWLHIPEICYSPVMRYCDGKYKNHNFLQKSNRFGELYLAENAKNDKLSEFRNDSEFIVKDLMTIKGSPLGDGTDLRHMNFSQLRKITEGIRENNEIEVQICENGKVRKFKAVGLIEKDKGNKHIFKYDSRESFINSLIDMMKIKTISRCPKKDVIFLECATDIDIVIVMLVEKG